MVLSFWLNRRGCVFGKFGKLRGPGLLNVTFKWQEPGQLLIEGGMESIELLAVDASSNTLIQVPMDLMRIAALQPRSFVP